MIFFLLGLEADHLMNCKKSIGLPSLSTNLLVGLLLRYVLRKNLVDNFFIIAKSDCFRYWIGLSLWFLLTFVHVWCIIITIGGKFLVIFYWMSFYKEQICHVFTTYFNPICLSFICNTDRINVISEMVTEIGYVEK